MSDIYGNQSAPEYGDIRPSEQVTMLDFSGDFLRQAQQAMESGTERHGSLEPDDSRKVTGTAGAVGQPGGANQQEGGERWGARAGGGGQASQTEPGVPQEGRPFSAEEASGQQQQNQSAGTAQVEFDAENAGAGQEVAFDADPQFEQEASAAGQQTQFDPGPGQQGGGSDVQGDTSGIREHMEVIGADGVHLGTVDHVDGDRIKLTKADSGMGSHEGHHHYISRGLVAGVEGDKVRLSATAANAYAMEQEQ